MKKLKPYSVLITARPATSDVGSTTLRLVPLCFLKFAIELGKKLHQPELGNLESTSQQVLMVFGKYSVLKKALIPYNATIMASDDMLTYTVVFADESDYTYFILKHTK